MIFIASSPARNHYDLDGEVEHVHDEQGLAVGAENEKVAAFEPVVVLRALAPGLDFRLGRALPLYRTSLINRGHRDSPKAKAATGPGMSRRRTCDLKGWSYRGIEQRRDTDGVTESSAVFRRCHPEVFDQPRAITDAFWRPE